MIDAPFDLTWLGKPLADGYREVYRGDADTLTARSGRTEWEFMGSIVTIDARYKSKIPDGMPSLPFLAKLQHPRTAADITGLVVYAEYDGAENFAISFHVVE